MSLVSNQTARDIITSFLERTQLKQYDTDNKLHDSIKVYLDDLEEMISFGTWYWDIRNNTMSWSEGLFRIMGYERFQSDFKMTDFLNVIRIHPEDVDRFYESMNNILQNKNSFTHQYRIFDIHGNLKHISSKVRVVLNQQGELAYAMGIEHDVSFVKNTISELTDFKDRVTAHETLLKIGTWEYDLTEGKFKFSDGFKRMLKHEGEASLSDFLFKNFVQKKIEILDVIKESAAIDEPTTLEGEVISDGELTDEHGRKVALQVFCRVMYDSKGNAVKIIGSMKDVTDLQESDRQLKQKMEELNRSNKELEEFAYIASHDLQEPLRKLITFSDRLEKTLLNMPAEASMYLQRMRNSAYSMKTLIENLLEFSRITRVKTKFQKTDLNSILQQVLQELELNIEETQASFELGTLPTLNVVPHQIQQVFFNLINNSLKFRKQQTPLVIKINAVDLTPAEAKKYNLAEKKAYCKITIEDNGIGFEQEYHEKIFQLFQRLNSKNEYPGTGIGLAICRKVMSFHKGLIYVHSTPNVGTVFSLILPYSTN